MRALLYALCLTVFATGADATSLKAHYGHYYAMSVTDNTTTDVQAMCAKKGIIGISYRVAWGGVEPTDGTWNDTDFDQVLATIAAMGPASGGAPNNSCRVWLLPEWKVFSSTTYSGNPCPSWLKDSAGLPGFAPNTFSTSTVTIAAGAGSVTNASPIVVTTSSAHGLSNGDSVFVDLVAGNTAANGTWTVANKTSTTFQLSGSHGNGARTGSFGKVTKGASHNCKMWDSNVLTKFLALIDHLATKYDGNANVEGFILQESAQSQTGAYDQTSASGGTYTGTAWEANIISIVQRCSSQFVASRCMAFLNFIEGNNAGMGDVSAAISALPDNQGCYSGPDILPSNSSLNSANRTYQFLIRHVGCRSNSAQNTTIIGSGGGQPACAANDCFNIFQFAVQGIFGQLSTGQPIPAGEGLCVNSYLFWNNLASEQVKVDPTVQKFPYGNQWYGQCNCGGGPP